MDDRGRADPTSGMTSRASFLAVLLAVPAMAAAPAPSAPQKSVRGSLSIVDKRLNGVSIVTEDGRRLAWRFKPAVIAKVAEIAIGSPAIVIYRQRTANEKQVTAIAFPGTAATPIYENLTGSRILLRSAPAKGGVCGVEGAGPVTDTTVPVDGRAEVNDACWCCAPAGETCSPGTKSGLGRAFLHNCFN